MPFFGTKKQPLTELGKKQAIALGESGRIEPNEFWRLSASDLQRAQDTAQLILQGTQVRTGKELISKSVLQESVILDDRLRELSKGARQGYHKTLSNEEATIERRKEAESQGKQFKVEDLPRLETELDGYTRFNSWLFDLVWQAIQEHKINVAGNEQQPFLAMAVSHSALIRSVLTNIFSEEILLSHDAVYSPPGHLTVPNTSLTILDIVPNMDHENWEAEAHASLPKMATELWTSELVELCWVGHYRSIS